MWPWYYVWKRFGLARCRADRHKPAETRPNAPPAPVAAGADAEADTIPPLSVTASTAETKASDVAHNSAPQPEQVKQRGCVVMYDSRLPAEHEAWFWSESKKPVDQRRQVLGDGHDNGSSDSSPRKRRQDQPFDWYLSCLAMMQINHAYASRHGYTFRFQSQYVPCWRPGDSPRVTPPTGATSCTVYPPYWAKVRLVRDALMEFEQSESGESGNRKGGNDGIRRYDYVMWLDTDACVDVKAHAVSIADMFKTYTSPTSAQSDDGPFLLFSPDQPEWPSTFCAGVFLVRNTARAREFFETWLSKYRPDAWTFNTQTGHWECSGEWAGELYEQGSAARLVDTPDYAPYVRRLDWAVLSNHNYKGSFSNGFARHFAGRYKLYIEPYVERHYTFLPTFTNQFQQSSNQQRPTKIVWV